MDGLTHFARKAVPLLPIVCIIMLAVVLNVTSPVSAGPAGILAVFLIFYVFATCLFYGFLRVLLLLGHRFFRASVSRRAAARISCVLAFAPLLILALSTLGGVGVIEAVLVFMLVALGCFYVSRRLGDDSL